MENTSFEEAKDKQISNKAELRIFFSFNMRHRGEVRRREWCAIDFCELQALLRVREGRKVEYEEEEVVGVSTRT